MGNTHQRSTGYRSGTRDLFSKKHRTKGGNQPLTTFLRRYKVGDIVDVVCDASQQKGMPHKFYHGRTGKVWNVNKRAIGVEINKVHREKQIVKRIHVRVEHVRPSKSHTGHLERINKNEALKKAAKASGKPCDLALLKRAPKGPREAFELNLGNTFEGKTHLLTPVPYVFKPISRNLNV
ncbi:MAG: hypothetical protein SGPRY_001470 [Prymnesium sp.]